MPRSGSASIWHRRSSPPVKAAGGTSKKKSVVRSRVLALTWPVAWWGVALFGALAVLGTWDVLQTRSTLRRNYPLTVLHEYRMTQQSLLDTLDWIGANDLALLRARTGTGAGPAQTPAREQTRRPCGGPTPCRVEKAHASPQRGPSPVIDQGGGRTQSRRRRNCQQPPPRLLLWRQ